MNPPVDAPASRASRPRGVDVEPLEGGRQLLAAARHVASGRPGEVHGVGGRDERGGVGRRTAPDGDEARRHRRGRGRGIGRETPADELGVETPPRHLRRSRTNRARRPWSSSPRFASRPCASWQRLGFLAARLQARGALELAHALLQRVDLRLRGHAHVLGLGRDLAGDQLLHLVAVVLRGLDQVRGELLRLVAAILAEQSLRDLLGLLGRELVEHGVQDPADVVGVHGDSFPWVRTISLPA